MNTPIHCELDYSDGTIRHINMFVTMRNIFPIQQNKRTFHIAQKCKYSKSFAEKLH